MLLGLGRIGAGPDLKPAAELLKADLMTAMVGGFPARQGTMGIRWKAALNAFAITFEGRISPRPTRTPGADYTEDRTIPKI